MLNIADEYFMKYVISLKLHDYEVGTVGMHEEKGER